MQYNLCVPQVGDCSMCVSFDVMAPVANVVGLSSAFEASHIAQ